MSGTTKRLIATCALLLLFAGQGAQAQFAVIDAASLTQLLQQAQTLGQQLEALRAQLAQAQSLYQSMTGSRGMQQLLNGTLTNYLPTDWMQLTAAMQGGGLYSSLGGDVSSAVAANAVLSAAQLAALSGDEQGQITTARQSVALLQGLAEEALVNSSNRFSQLQQLIGTISSASDQKGILELQATIGAEQGMLQSEQTKLQVLYQAAQAEQWAGRQHERELIIAGQGRFASRFEPSPL